MSTPIELHFYNKKNEVIKTNLDIIYEFVRDFYGRQFSVKQLKKYTDVEQLLAVTGQIVMRVITMMEKEGVDFPNA